MARAALLLAAGGVGVPDVVPGSTYDLDVYARIRDAVARLAVEDGLGDRVAWESLFDAVFVLESNRKRLRVTRRRRRRLPARSDAPTLFP